METITNCPICNSPERKAFLACVDYTVSMETFKIEECASCGFRFTNPRPSEKEIGKYYQSEEYISHSGTKKGFMNKLYHGVRSYALIKKLQLINSLSKRGTLLDIGCGTGEFLELCKKDKWKVIGVEPDPKAKEKANSLGIQVGEESILKTLEENTFDIITMWHVLEHVHNLNERVEEVKSLLKENGALLVAVPNCSSYDAEKYGKYWAAYDVPRHLYHFRPNDIRELFKKHEMEVSRILPMWFDSFYVSMLSEKYRSKTTNHLIASMVGLLSNIKAIRTGEKYSSQIYIIYKKTP